MDSAFSHQVFQTFMYDIRCLSAVEVPVCVVMQTTRMSARYVGESSAEAVVFSPQLAMLES